MLGPIPNPTTTARIHTIIRLDRIHTFILVVLLRNTMYKAMHICVKCKKRLSFETIMCSHGVCPYCGNTSGDTMINYKTISYKARSLGERFNDWLSRLLN